LRLKYLRHRFGGKLSGGGTAADHVLFYSERSNQPRNLDIRRVDEQRVLILRQGKPWGLFVADAKQHNPQNPEVLFYTPGYVVFINKPSGESPDTVALEINLKNGEAHTYATAPAAWRWGGRTFSIPAGKSSFALGDLRTRLAREAALALNNAARQGKEPKPTERLRLPYPSLRKLWSIPAVAEQRGEKAAVHCLQVAEITGDGKPEFLVGRGSQVVAFALEGKELWALLTGARVNDIAVADLDNDTHPEVLVASDDEHLYITDAQGRLRTKIRCSVGLRVGTSSVRQPRVAHVCVGDVDGDGKPDVIVGTRNGNIARYETKAICATFTTPEAATASRDLKPLWSFDQIEHGTFRMRLVDLDHDGTLEIVAGNRYGAVEILNHRGEPLPGTYSELGDVVFAVDDVNADGKPEILNGSSTGAFTCATWREKNLWNFDNYGYGVREIITGDLDADGEREVAVASETGYIYMLRGDGTIKRMRQLSAPVLCMAQIDSQLVAGCQDGVVYVLNAQLQPVKALQLQPPITHLATAKVGGMPIILAAANGSLVGLQP